MWWTGWQNTKTVSLTAVVSIRAVKSAKSAENQQQTDSQAGRKWCRRQYSNASNMNGREKTCCKVKIDPTREAGIKREMSKCLDLLFVWLVFLFVWQVLVRSYLLRPCWPDNAYLPSQITLCDRQHCQNRGKDMANGRTLSHYPCLQTIVAGRSLS